VSDGGIGSRSRSVASGLLIGLGALLFVLGVVYLWANDTLFNADRFAGTVVQAVEQPAVKAEITEVIVDQTIAARSDLITVKPLLETVVSSVISSPAFRRILTTAAADVHRTLFTTDQSSLVLDISDVMTVVVGGLRAFDPDLASRIPPNLEAGIVQIGDRSYAGSFAGIAEDVRYASIAFIVAGLAALAGGVALARNRPRAVVGLGIAIAAAALLVFGGLLIAREIVVHQFESLATASAVGETFDVFSASLVGWMWILGIAGVVLAAATSATIRVGDARARLLEIWGRVTTMPASRLGRLAYGVAAIAAGALVVAYPSPAMNLFVRGVGLLAIYLGGAELLRLAGVGQAAPVAAGPARASVPWRPVLGTRVLAGGAIAAAAVVGAVVIWGNRDALRSNSIAEAAEVERCNGHAELCDKPLNEVAFAGSHNSMSAARLPGWYFASHDGGIPVQLEAGVRAFLIDTHYGFPGQRGTATDLNNAAQRAQIEATLDPGMIAAATRLSDRRSAVRPGTKHEVFLCHGFCELGATSLDTDLAKVRDFLRANPHEVIILFFEDYVTPEDADAAFTRSRLIDYVYTHTPGDPWPTLREMIERDQRVLVLSENVGDKSRPAWYHDGWSLAQETPFSFKTPADFNCLPNRGQASNPLFQINHWVEKLTPMPNDSATVNAYDFLLARAQQCQQERGRLPNIIAVNFYEIGDLLRVVDTLNGVESEEK
jgi:hypothetical protein